MLFRSFPQICGLVSKLQVWPRTLTFFRNDVRLPPLSVSVLLSSALWTRHSTILGDAGALRLQGRGISRLERLAFLGAQTLLIKVGSKPRMICRVAGCYQFLM